MRFKKLLLVGLMPFLLGCELYAVSFISSLLSESLDLYVFIFAPLMFLVYFIANYYLITFYINQLKSK